jgi:hypothetical protein
MPAQPATQHVRHRSDEQHVRHPRRGQTDWDGQSGTDDQHHLAAVPAAKLAEVEDRRCETERVAHWSTSPPPGSGRSGRSWSHLLIAVTQARHRQCLTSASIVFLPASTGLPGQYRRTSPLRIRESTYHHWAEPNGGAFDSILGVFTDGAAQRLREGVFQFMTAFSLPWFGAQGANKGAQGPAADHGRTGDRRHRRNRWPIHRRPLNLKELGVVCVLSWKRLGNPPDANPGLVDADSKP